MRKGEVSRVYREFPADARRLSKLPRHPGDVLQRDPARHQPSSPLGTDGRPYRIVRRQGEWIVEFTQSQDSDGGPLT